MGPAPGEINYGLLGIKKCSWAIKVKSVGLEVMSGDVNSSPERYFPKDPRVYGGNKFSSEGV